MSPAPGSQQFPAECRPLPIDLEAASKEDLQILLAKARAELEAWRELAFHYRRKYECATTRLTAIIDNEIELRHEARLEVRRRRHHEEDLHLPRLAGGMHREFYEPGLDGKHPR